VDQIRTVPHGTMLYEGICRAYGQGIGRLMAMPGVQTLRMAAMGLKSPTAPVYPAVFATDVLTFTRERLLHQEVFGPSTVIVTGESKRELLEVAMSLEGQLTATVHGTPDELQEYRDLIAILETKVGRLDFNGFPTGINPHHPVPHAGPDPAPPDPR